MRYLEFLLLFFSSLVLFKYVDYALRLPGNDPRKRLHFIGGIFAAVIALILFYLAAATIVNKRG